MGQEFGMVTCTDNHLKYCTVVAHSFESRDGLDGMTGNLI
jgi:hypothetical protein